MYDVFFFGVFVEILDADGDLAKIVAFFGVGGLSCRQGSDCTGSIVCVKLKDLEALPTGVIGLGIREGVEGLPVGVAGRLTVAVSFVGWVVGVTMAVVDSFLLTST